jgi:predicted amidohydrolase
VPTAWVAGFDRRAPGPATGIGQVDGVLVQANLDGVFVACADQVGSCRTVEFLGRSLVADPFGTAVCGPLDARSPQVATAAVDLGLIAAAQDRGAGIRPRADRRTDVYDSMLGYRSPVISGERR